MKNEKGPLNRAPCSQPVLAASTPVVPAFDAEQHADRSSLIRSGTCWAPGRMRLTERDVSVVDLVLRCRALRADQIHSALFPPGSDSRSQLRLTLLARNRYLDRLPRRSVNEPSIYVLTRSSVSGNRLMRARWGEMEFRHYMTRLGSVPHLLGVNDVRVRIERAIRDLGWSLARWDRPEDLAPAMKRFGLVPDAYFQVQRAVTGAVKTSGFCLELERSVKSRKAVEGKLRAYIDLYRSGRYEEIFGTRALRVLVVYTNEPYVRSEARAAGALQDAERVGAGLARFATLDEIRRSTPLECLSAPLWRAPGAPLPVALFSGLPARPGP